MTLPIQTPEDVINLALTRIGYTRAIANIYEGSMAANAALAIYSQTRDEILRQSDWWFAERTASLTLLKSAPVGGYIPPTAWSSAYPPLPYLFEYAYPVDCLKVRAVKNVPLFVPNFDPQPHTFAVANDNSLVPPARVILCNVASAVMTYTAQVTDPTSWEADFIEALASALGRRLAPSLSKDATQLEVADEVAAMHAAEREQG